MAKREVTIETKAEIIKVFMDGKNVRLDGGEGSTKVDAGTEHAMTWAVRGAPGTKYSVKVTSPKEAQLEHAETLGSEGFDAGIAWFRVAEA